jgi:hypothetical protein
VDYTPKRCAIASDSEGRSLTICEFSPTNAQEAGPKKSKKTLKKPSLSHYDGVDVVTILTLRRAAVLVLVDGFWWAMV